MLKKRMLHVWKRQNWNKMEKHEWKSYLKRENIYILFKHWSLNYCTKMLHIKIYKDLASPYHKFLQCWAS